MLTFILGSPCSGKSYEMAKRTATDLKNGKEVVFIVPEQNVLTSERAISEVISKGAELFSLETVSFRRLCDTVFRRSGGLCYNYLDKSGQAIIMWRVLSELAPDLNTYRTGDNTDIGLISSLISLYDEFYDYRVTPIDFEYAVEALPKELKPKATDIATIFNRYDELIHEDFDSEKDDLLRAARAITENSLFKGASVYIDNFTSFTPSQYEVIEALLIQAENVYVSLCMNTSRDQEIFLNLIKTRKRVSDIAQKHHIEINDDIILFADKREEMAFFEENCYDPLPKEKFTPKTNSISRINAVDIYNECELLAADIMREVRGGLRFRDVCIVMADSAAYEGKLDQVLRRHNIPFHFNSEKSIIDMPMYKYIISALDVVTYNWRLNDVIAHLKTGLCDLCDDEADLLEEYAETWSVSGSLWKLEGEWRMNPNGYTDRVDIKTLENLEKVNRGRDKLRASLMELDDDLTPKTKLKDAAQILYSFIKRTVKTESFTDEETVCYNAVCTALEQLYACGGDFEIGSTENLKRLIKMVACHSDINIIPSTVDEINCTSITALRSSGYKKCYVIGAVEGTYPTLSANKGIIDDEMRTHLCNAGLKLPHDPDEAYTDELYLFWKAVLSAEKTVISNYSSTLDAKKIIPSACIYELDNLFEDIKTEEFSVYDLLYDKASAYDAITSKDTEIADSALTILENYSEFKDLIATLKTPIETTKCILEDPDNLKKFAGDINLTQTRVESFVKCKFAYHLEHILNLNEQRKITYDPRDVGVFIHSLLEEYFKRFNNALKKGEKLSRDEIESTVEDIVSVYRQQTIGDNVFISKRLEALFARLKRVGVLFVRSIYDEFDNSEFSPILFEVSITNSNDNGISPYKVELSDGTSIHIYGQIDRVDTFEKDGEVYVRVVDYKTGKKEFSRADLEKGLNLQMFLYMLSIMENEESFCAMTDHKGKVVPAGVLYYIARLPSDIGNHIFNDSELEKVIIDNIERQGLVLDDPEILSAMSKDGEFKALPDGIIKKPGSRKERPVYTLEGFEDIRNSIAQTLTKIAESMKSGEAHAQPPEDDKKHCERCRMRAICRRIEREEDEDE